MPLQAGLKLHDRELSIAGAQKSPLLSHQNRQFIQTSEQQKCPSETNRD